MFKRIREFLARRRRMREFVAAGREHHGIQAYQPDWVDTMPLELPKRRVRAGVNVNPPPLHAKPPAPPSPPPVRREQPMSLVPADSPDSFDTMSALMMANIAARQRDESLRSVDSDQPWPRSVGGGDFGGAGASGSWEAAEPSRSEVSTDSSNRDSCSSSSSSSD